MRTSITFRPPSTIFTMLLLVLWFTGGAESSGWAQQTPLLIADAAAFFPDQRGNEWRYQGRILEGVADQISDETFSNISTVKGEETVKGVTLTVFHDTNPGNQGPSDSYYRRDAAGIRYYGSKPGTTLERQLIPYQIIRFPIEIPSSFQQLNRKNLDLGIDIDRDGRKERVDILATVTVSSQESISVPLGTYPDAIRMEAHMHMKVFLSRAGEIVTGSDTMTAWFVRGIGLVKYTERQIVPMLEGTRDKIIEITEELEETNLSGGTVLHRGSKSAT